MAGPIQRQPFGLTDLLSIKGQSPPHVLGDSMVGVIDVRPHYQRDILETLAGPQTVGALANRVDTFTTPAQLGLVAIGGALTVGAAGGTNLLISCCIQMKTTLVSIPLFQIYVATFVAGQVIEFGGMLPHTLVLAAGVPIFTRAWGTAAGADHALNVSCLIEDYSN